MTLIKEDCFYRLVETILTLRLKMGSSNRIEEGKGELLFRRKLGESRRKSSTLTLLKILVEREHASYRTKKAILLLKIATFMKTLLFLPQFLNQQQMRVSITQEDRCLAI